MRRIVLAASLFMALLLAGCHEPEPGTGDDNLRLQPDPEVESINVTLAPPTALAGSEAVVCWEVQGHGTVPHIDVHWDNESHAGAGPLEGYDGGFSFPGNGTRVAPDGYQVPRHYCSTIPVAAGNETLYWRAHAVALDAPGIVSEEQTIVVLSG